MQKTKVLGSLRSIFPPIHQPLLNKGESERLLNAIKTSFRAQLATEHGDHQVGPSPRPTTAPLTYLPSDPAPSSTRRAHHAPTDRHLHAILNNPLFSQTQTTESTEVSDSSWVAHKAVFEKAVGRGLMTMQRAHGFLVLVLNEVKQSAAPTVLEGMKSTCAGLLVLQWLRASGLEQSQEFLNYRAFRALLVRFLIAEGLEDVVWTWIDRLMKNEHENVRQDSAGAPLPPLSAFLLEDIVAAKCTETELEGAYATILKARDMVEENSQSPASLVLPWRSLAWQTTVESWRHITPPAHLFEQFVEIGNSTETPVISRAHVALYHPTNPSSDLAVDTLSKENIWERLERVKYTPGARPPQFVQAITSLGIDTVQHLMQADRMREATRILDVLKGSSRWVDGRTSTAFPFRPKLAT